VVLEPGYALGIEVVGRFVEKEQIWFLKRFGDLYPDACDKP
jgi:hypothetical protein